MFKTRKPTTQVTILANPRIDFDYAELTKSAKLFLGKDKAEKLLGAAFKKPETNSEGPTNRNEKEFLVLLAHMEHAARYYRDHPQDEAKWEPTENNKEDAADAPYYVPQRQTKNKDARRIRNHYVHEFLQVIALRTEKSYRLNLPYRLRSQAQRTALVSNRSEIVRDEKAKGTENEYKLRIHISTADLPRISASLARGDNSLALKLSPDSQVPNKAMPIEILWTDELPHRPELTRQILGRQTDALLEDGVEALHKIGQEERGARIHILGGNNCRGTYERTAKGEIQVTLEPQVEIKSGLEAFENEVGLMEYLNEQYSCSPQEFFLAVPNITAALEENLEKSARTWLNIPEDEAVSEEEKNTFLQEYTSTCLTLQTVPTPLGSISLNRMKEWKRVQDKNPAEREKNNFERAKNSRDLLTETHDVLQKEEKVAPIIELPFERAIQRIQEEAFGNIASVNPGASISKEWMDLIAASAIEEANPNPYEANNLDPDSQERQIRALESVASALGVNPDELRARRKLILENFYGVGEGKSIDTPEIQKASFMGYALSDENREKFYRSLEYFNQRDFESKGDKPLDGSGNEMTKPELAAFVQDTETVELEIPLNANSLHRLTRYPTGLRASGKDVTRYPYGHPKHLPRDRGQKNNAVQELKVEDFLSAKGIEDLKALSKGDVDEATKQKITKIYKTVENWNKGYGLILPNRPSSPIDARAGQWLTALLRAKKDGGGHEDKKCHSVIELSNLLNCLSRIAGMKVGGVDTPLQTQPLPSVSSSIPLQLLCGVKAQDIKELQTIHENPIELRDLEARWENALKADIGQEPNMQFENKELDLILDADAKTRETKNIEAVLQEPEDHLKNFNLSMGLSAAGAENLDKDLKAFRPLLPLLKSSPLTIKMHGEELTLSTLCNIAANNMLPEVREKFLSITPEEQSAIETSLQKRAIEFKGILEAKAEKINSLSRETDPLKPRSTGEVTILFPEEDKDAEIQSVSSGLSDALLAVEEEEKRSGKTDQKWVQSVARAITNTQTAAVAFGANAEITVTKTLHGSLETTLANPEGEKSPQVELTLQTLKALAGEENTLPDELKETVKEVLQEAKSQEILNNAKELLDILKSIPNETARSGATQKEFEEAKTRLDTIVKLDQAQKSLDFQAKNWGYFDETQTGSIETAQIVFDFSREFDQITKKGFGTDKEMDPLRAEFAAQNAEEARKVFLSQGENGVRDYLRKKGEAYFLEQKSRMSRESTRLLKAIATDLMTTSEEINKDGSIREDSKNEALKTAVNAENGLFRKICALVETNRIFAKKLQEAERQTENISQTLDKDAPKPKSILPPAIRKGDQAPGTFQVQDGKILTDKIWIKDILESQRGQEKLLLGTLATNWASEGKDRQARRERAALLIYLKTQGLQKEAVLASRTPEGKAALDKIATIWTAKLATIHIDGNKGINTLLAGTSALQQIEAEKLFGKELIKTLEKDGKLLETETPKPKIEFQFQNWSKAANRVPSAYLTGEEREEAEKNLEKRRDDDTKGTKIRQIRGAAEVLHGHEASFTDR